MSWAYVTPRALKPCSCIYACSGVFVLNFPRAFFTTKITGLGAATISTIPGRAYLHGLTARLNTSLKKRRWPIRQSVTNMCKTTLAQSQGHKHVNFVNFVVWQFKTIMHLSIQWMVFTAMIYEWLWCFSASLRTRYRTVPSAIFAIKMILMSYNGVWFDFLHYLKTQDLSAKKLRYQKSQNEKKLHAF